MVVTAPSVRRMGAEERHRQLLEAGVQLARTVPLNQIAADDVAQAAGVSKGLVFHYFPTQRDLHAAVLASASAQLIELLVVDPGLPPADRLTAGIDAFVGFIEQQPISFQALARGTGGDPQLQGIFEDTRRKVVAIIASALGMEELPAGFRIAVRGWIAMVEETVLHWLDEGRPIARRELILFLQHAAVNTLPEALAIATGFSLSE